MYIILIVEILKHKLYIFYLSFDPRVFRHKSYCLFVQTLVFH